MTTSADTAQVVEQIAHPAVRMQLDTGALTINGEDPATVLHDSARLIGHVHASEPELLPLGDGGTDHAKVVATLEQHLPNHVVSIEMLATKNEPHEVSIERALSVAIQHYRNNRVGVNV
jgi:sugar phosphate isomerase/epimerase